MFHIFSLVCFLIYSGNSMVCIWAHMGSSGPIWARPGPLRRGETSRL